MSVILNHRFVFDFTPRTRPSARISDIAHAGPLIQYETFSKSRTVLSRLKCTRTGGEKKLFPRPHRTRALALEERGQAIQVERRVSPACVKTCEMEEEPVRPAILCCDRPLL